MAKSCFECMMKGFDIRIAYFVCFGIILFCLSVVPKRESFTSIQDIRTKVNGYKRQLRRRKEYHVKNIGTKLARLRRRFL